MEGVANLGVPPLHHASPHLPSARFMPAPATQRGSAGPLPTKCKLRFKRLSGSRTAAVEPEEDEPKATQRSCSKATGSVRFLIPRPMRPATDSARWPSPRSPRLSRCGSEETPLPGARRPSHSSPRPRQPATDPCRPISAQLPPAPPHPASSVALREAHPESPALTGSHLGEGRR